MTYKVNWQKDLKLKSWSDIELNLDKPVEKEKTAKEIEEEVIKKFKEWR